MQSYLSIIFTTYVLENFHISYRVYNVINCDIPGKGIKNVLVKVDTEHDCLMNLTRAIADEMKY